MAAVTPDLGHGTTITFQTGFFAKILSIGWDGIERPAVDSTTMETSGGKTFIPGKNYDPGELVIQMQFDTDSAWITALTAAPEAVTVTWPDGETASASGFLTNFSIGDVTNETIMTATGNLKLTGSITP